MKLFIKFPLSGSSSNLSLDSSALTHSLTHSLTQSLTYLHCAKFSVQILCLHRPIIKHICFSFTFFIKDLQLLFSGAQISEAKNTWKPYLRRLHARKKISLRSQIFLVRDTHLAALLHTKSTISKGRTRNLQKKLLWWPLLASPPEFVARELPLRQKQYWHLRTIWNIAKCTFEIHNFWRSWKSKGPQTFSGVLREHADSIRSRLQNVRYLCKEICKRCARKFACENWGAPTTDWGLTIVRAKLTGLLQASDQGFGQIHPS